MSGSNNMITMRQGEKWALERKAKQGWRQFFILRDNFDELAEYVGDLAKRNFEMRKQLEKGEDIDINYLKSQFIDMYDKLKHYTECPVCYELLTKENIEVSKCGHTICKTCYETIKATSTPVCPTCRAKY